MTNKEVKEKCIKAYNEYIFRRDTITDERGVILQNFLREIEAIKNDIETKQQYLAFS